MSGDPAWLICLESVYTCINAVRHQTTESFFTLHRFVPRSKQCTRIRFLFHSNGFLEPQVSALWETKWTNNPQRSMIDHPSVVLPNRKLSNHPGSNYSYLRNGSLTFKTICVAACCDSKKLSTVAFVYSPFFIHLPPETINRCHNGSINFSQVDLSEL